MWLLLGLSTHLWPSFYTLRQPHTQGQGPADYVSTYCNKLPHHKVSYFLNWFLHFSDFLPWLYTCRIVKAGEVNCSFFNGLTGSVRLPVKRRRAVNFPRVAPSPSLSLVVMHVTPWRNWFIIWYAASHPAPPPHPAPPRVPPAATPPLLPSPLPPGASRALL